MTELRHTVPQIKSFLQKQFQLQCLLSQAIDKRRLPHSSSIKAIHWGLAVLLLVFLESRAVEMPTLLHGLACVLGMLWTANCFSGPDAKRVSPSKGNKHRSNVGEVDWKLFPADGKCLSLPSDEIQSIFSLRKWQISIRCFNSVMSKK